MMPSAHFIWLQPSMIRGIKQTFWHTLALRRACTLTIGILLAIMPWCESLANVHGLDVMEHGHGLYLETVLVQTSTPCHDLQASPLSNQANDAPPSGVEFGETLAGYAIVASNPSTNQCRIPFRRNEQWRSDPAIHLSNCVFLN